MTVTYRGGTSQTTTTSAAVTGSTITANVASLVAGGVTFVPGSSMVAQFLIGGQSSVQIGTFNIKANTLVAGAVIKDVTVTVPANTIGSVTLNGVTGQVNGTTATLYNVGLTVPADASGINAPMTVSLVCVTAAGGGCAGVSNSTTSASITTVTYFDGSATQTISPSAVTPDHKLVASKPTVSMVDTNVSGLATTRVKLGEFSISADVAGDIKIEALPITLSASTGTSAITFTGVSLYNAAGDTVIVGSGGTNGTTVLTASGTFTFSTPRVITKNTTETYSVWGTVVDAAGLGASGTSSVSFGLGDKGTFAWTDVIGGVSAIPGTQLNTYPTTTYTKHN